MSADMSNSGVLNVCSPYTSRDEITTALRDTVQEVYDGSLPLRCVVRKPPYTTSPRFPFLALTSHLRPLAHTAGIDEHRNVTHDRIYRNLETCKSIDAVTRQAEADSGKIDIYVRTSDVRRLSDFQMWQVSLLLSLFRKTRQSASFTS